MSVAEITAEILKLSEVERLALARAIYGWEDDGWDQQIAKARADMAAGRCRELP